MSKKFLQAQLKKVGDKIQFIASDETLDRSGEVIPIETWDLVNFMMNPVLLVNHDYCVENIVGLAENIHIEDRKLVFEPVFHTITELAKQVADMVSEGILNTVSVGFIPHGPTQDGGIGRNELLEISFVAVPANPSAQRLKGLDAAVTPEEKVLIKSWVSKQNEILDAIRIEVLKSKFDESSAEAWVTEHNYKFVEKKETTESYVFNLVKSDVKCEGEIKTIQFEDGAVKLFACRVTEREGNDAQKMIENLTEKMGEQVALQVDALTKNLRDELTELKEGRVLSGKNRKRIEDAVSILKQASEALADLLAANEDNGKDAGKGREIKVDDETKAPKKLPSSVRRALQKINRETNQLLSEDK